MDEMIYGRARRWWDQAAGIGLMLGQLVLWEICVSLCAAEINPPIGPYVNLREEHFAETKTFTAADRLVLTPYFYWYDVFSMAHLIDEDGSDALTDHPATLDGFSYRSVSWHAAQLRDMIEAGIQVVLPVYWGEPSARLTNQPISAQPWSYAGLPPLVSARGQLIAEGLEPPRIGLFYDTSTLEFNAAGRKVDLTTPEGREWFYETVRDFYSLIPPKHWAMIDGHPIIFLYSAGFAAAHDQSCIDILKTSFARDFGGRVPYVVREVSWQVTADNAYAWGGALGLKNPGVASLGPGYDHSAVPGREPLVVDREGGAFFERNWIRFLRRPTLWVFVETWNEFHEGTDIAASIEYGREYIGLNRKYADLFQAGVRPALPRGPYSDFKEVDVELGETNVVHGVAQVESADGVTEAFEVAGSSCRRAVPTENGGRYIYFRIDDSFKWSEAMRIVVEVEYFDSGSGGFTIEFDGSDLEAPFQGAYTRAARRVALAASETWRRATFTLVDARFLNSQNSGADFRIVVEAEAFAVRRVRVRRLGLPDEAGKVLNGLSQDFSGAIYTNWISWGADGANLRQSDGMMRMEGGVDGKQRFACIVPGGGLEAGEILARVRVSKASVWGGWLGGAFWGAASESAPGLECQLRAGSGGAGELVLRDSSVGLEQASVVNWQANRWYWLRIRHDPSAISGYPDVVARFWPADGETREPWQWQVYWDYYPLLPLRRGQAGLLLPGHSAGVALECDFFLVRSEALPEALVRLPDLKPERARLSWSTGLSAPGQELCLRGTPYQAYAIESTSDFREWSSKAVFTDAIGLTLLHVIPGATHASHYYRARVGD